MNRSRKFKQRIGDTVESFMLLFIKKHLSLKGCAKKLCRVVARLNRSTTTLCSLLLAEKAFLLTTQWLNNMTTVPSQAHDHN